MKILVATASPWSGLADTAMLLAQAGLKPALPAPVGADVFQSAADWHTQLLQTLDLHPEGLNATGPLPVGKLWEDMAVGLLRANLGPADWFMADTRATWALDFWASIDPQARFLLLYLPAEAALYTARQQALATQPKGTQAAEAWDATAAALAWLRHNRQLLRAAQTHAARTLLVNAQQAQLHPQRLLTTVADALGVQVPASAPDGWDAPIYLSAPIEALVPPALAAELRALSRQLREAQTPLLSGGTQLVLAPEAQASVAKAPSRLGWLGKNKQAEQALASTSAELAHTQADLGHAQDLITALAAKTERLHHSLAHAEQAHSHTLAVLQQAQEQAQESADQQTAALAQAQGELTLANAQLHLLRTELQTQRTERQTQTGVLTQQISTLKAQLEAAAQQATSVPQAKSSEMAELSQEGDLLLQQLHQVQEELEKIYHECEALKPQLAAAEQAKAQAEKAKAEAESKAAELSKQAQEAKVAKELADKAKTAAEQKNADWAQRAIVAPTSHQGDTKALQEALQENELLLKQLHQVQEELETYFLKHQEMQQAQSGATERLNRLLQRLPTWADAEHLSAQLVLNEPEHRCLRVQAKQVWIGQDAPLGSLEFLFGERNSVPYLEFRPGNEGVPKQLLPWPAELSDEKGPRLLLAPTAPAPIGPMQAEIVAQLTASQWRMVRSLLVLVGSHIGRLGQAAQADRVLWADAARQLTQKLEEISPGLHHEGVEVLAVAQPTPGLETIRLAIKQINTRNKRIPLLVFELGLQHKTVKGKRSPQAMYLEFRQWKATVPPFAGWKPNGQDAQGPFMRLNYPLKGKQRPQPAGLAELTLDDQALLASLQVLLPSALSGVQFARYTMQAPIDVWTAALYQLPYAPKLDVDSGLNAVLLTQAVEA